MNRLAVPLLACVVGCGRLDFGEVSDKPVPDADDRDKCPHIRGSIEDTDGDSVGDACDPHPSTPGDQITLFSPLTPGTSPFDDITGATEEPDGLHHVGDGSLFITRPLATARIEVGFDILGIIGTGQHQLGLGIPRAGEPYYFAELNDNTGATVRDMAIFSYDSVNGYVPLDMHDIPPLHTGRGIIRIDADATAHTYTAVAGWDGELYNAMASTPQYNGGIKAHLSLNGLDLVIRYIIIIESP